MLRRDLHDVELEERRSRGEVDVAVVEARQGKLALEVDDPRLRPALRQGRFVIADENKPAAPDGHGRRPRLRVVDGPDRAVAKDQISRRLTGRSAGEKQVTEQRRAQTPRSAHGGLLSEEASWHHMASQHQEERHGGTQVEDA